MRRHLLTATLIASLSLCTAAISAVLFVLYFSKPGPLPQPSTVIITSGDSLPQITQLLANEKVISHPRLFSWHIRLRSEAQNLQAGEYRFAAHVTPQDVLTALTQGTTIQHAFTVPEGITMAQVLDQIEKTDLLLGDITLPIAEGEILPETYAYTRNEPRNQVLKRMRKSMQEVVQKLWTSRELELPLSSPEDAIIMASIVEKETKLTQERPRIAAVLLNRLKRGMKLQADPTVLYGLNLERAEPTQQLTKKDLEHASPYNTYLHLGLPPTPICNPGYASIHAVLHPSKTDELFFVADGSGGHVFSNTYKSHKQHHQNWRKMQLKLRNAKNAG